MPGLALPVSMLEVRCCPRLHRCSISPVAGSKIDRPCFLQFVLCFRLVDLRGIFMLAVLSGMSKVVVME